MPVSVKELVAAAHAVVPGISAEDARARMAEGALLLDVREESELVATGTAEGAYHVPRGLLEFRADPESPLHDPELRHDRTVILYCMAGGRAALAGQILQQMGFADVHNLGGFKDWQASGAPVVPVGGTD